MLEYFLSIYIILRVCVIVNYNTVCKRLVFLRDELFYSTA